MDCVIVGFSFVSSALISGAPMLYSCYYAALVNELSVYPQLAGDHKADVVLSVPLKIGCV